MLFLSVYVVFLHNFEQSNYPSWHEVSDGQSQRRLCSKVCAKAMENISPVKRSIGLWTIEMLYCIKLYCIKLYCIKWKLLRVFICRAEWRTAEISSVRLSLSSTSSSHSLPLTLPCHSRVTAFQRRSDAFNVSLLLDTHKLDSYRGHGYHVPQEKKELPSGIESFPAIFSFPGVS